MPRVVGRQVHRNSIPADNPEQFYIRNVVIPFLDDIIGNMRERYDLKNKHLLTLFGLLPASIIKLKDSADRKYMHAYWYYLTLLR